jgi:hypothetical protein
MRRHVATMGERRGAYRVVMGEAEGKWPPGRRGRRRREANVKFILNRDFFIPTRLWGWNRQSVPKRWHIKFRRQGITQKKAYDFKSVIRAWIGFSWLKRRTSCELLWIRHSAFGFCKVWVIVLTSWITVSPARRTLPDSVRYEFYRKVGVWCRLFRRLEAKLFFSLTQKFFHFGFFIMPYAYWQFVVTHTIRQTEIPALLYSSVTNTPVKMLCPQKITCPYIFVKT